MSAVLSSRPPYATANEVCELGWRYADDIIEGRIPACGHVKTACARAVARRDDPGALRFDVDAAARPILFARFLTHLKGPLSGQPIYLEPWQIFMIMQIYGWIREDGYRMVRSVYVEIPRKSLSLIHI